MSDVSDIDWTLVGKGLLGGNYNLLIGAGVSLDSKSRLNKEFLPTLGALRDELEKKIDGVRPGSSISRIYKAIRRAERVDELITSRFDGCVPGETVKEFPKFRWKRIFSLNVDDALEAAYEQDADRLQRAVVFNFNQPYADVRDIGEVPLVHLHGFARRSDDGYVFDINEYARNIRSNNIWAHNLAGFIRSEPFVILGSSLEETDLEYFLADRYRSVDRFDRPPSILVEPYPDEATLSDCEEYNLRLFEGTSLDFFEELNARFPDRPTISRELEAVSEGIAVDGLDKHELARFYADFERVPVGTAIGSATPVKFAYGHSATWGDIAAGVDLPRQAVADIQREISTVPPGKYVLMSGDAGSGKSTSLKRLAFNLSQDGEICFFHRAIGKVRIEALRAIVENSPKKIYIFIDNFADYSSEFAEILAELDAKKVLFVCAERGYRIDHIERVLGADVTREFKIGAIGPGLAPKLIAKYADLGLLDEGINDDYSNPIDDDPIAIACCRILNDFEPIERIVQRSIEDAQQRDRDCYLFAAVSSYCFRQGIDYNVISHENPGYVVDILSDDIVPLPLEIIERSGAEFVKPLNEAFSDTILKGLSESEAGRQWLLKIFKSIARGIAPRVSVQAISNGEPSARLASRLFDYDDVVKPLLGVEGAEEFYDATKSDWDWNSRYWHQIALLKMDSAAQSDGAKLRDELSKTAVQHANFAKRIEPDHQFTYTMIGRMLFQRMEVLGRATAEEIGGAIAATSRAIAIERRRGRVTIHPFMILFRGVSGVLDLGAHLSPKQRGEVGEHIRTSMQSFARDEGLMAAARELQTRL